MLHIDHEQGGRLDRERYQRITRGAAIDPRALDGKLDLVTSNHGRDTVSVLLNQGNKIAIGRGCA